MDRSEILTLIKEGREQDAYGVWQPVEHRRDVFCSAESVTRAEFFEGGRNGLNPEFKFVCFFGDYEGERTVEYKGKRYGVYRTFFGKTDEIELYAERKGGTNGEDNG